MRPSSIAGLRGLAVFLVVLNHYNTIVFTNWHIGNVGVAVFFSISGFLAYYVLRRDEERWGEVRYGYFLIRRVLRIWPLYFFMIALAFYTEKWFGNIQPPPLSLFLFIFNFDLANGHHPGLTSLSIFWSIAVEEQFYVLAPLLYRVLRSRYCIAFCAVIFIGANAARLVYLAYVPQPIGGGLYYTTLAYVDTFVAGALLAHVLSRRSLTAAPSKVWAWVAFLIAAALLLAIARIWAFGEGSPLSFLPYSDSADAGTTLIWSAIAAKTAFSAVLSSAPLRAAGALSFGIYATHTYVQNYLYHHVRPSPPMFTEYGVVIYNIGTISCTLLLATALYFLLKRPVLSLKRYFTPAPAPAAAGTA